MFKVCRVSIRGSVGERLGVLAVSQCAAGLGRGGSHAAP
jgi:hypothetical protein